MNLYLTNVDINVQKISGVATVTPSLSTMASHLLNLGPRTVLASGL